MKRKIFVTIFLLLITVYLGYNYLYQDHRNISVEQPEFIVNSKDIAKEFSQDPINTEKKYLNKTIEVYGIITEKNTSDITLDDVVFCVFDMPMPIQEKLILNNSTKIKGRVIGYDDLLEQIKIDQTSIIK